MEIEQLIVLFIIGCLVSFILGAAISAKVSKSIEENEYNYKPKCIHEFKYKEVGEVDGFVWRDVCKKCGHTKI